MTRRFAVRGKEQTRCRRECTSATRASSCSAPLRVSAGPGTVAGNVTEALTTLSSTVAVAIVALITFRDDLRARLRQARPGGGVPLAGEAAAMLAAYLRAERDLGRLAPDADVDKHTPTHDNTRHQQFADR